MSLSYWFTRIKMFLFVCLAVTDAVVVAVAVTVATVVAIVVAVDNKITLV